MSRTTTADQEIAAQVRRATTSTAIRTQGVKRKKTAKENSTHSLDNEAVHDGNDSARQADARTGIDRDSDLPETWIRPSKLLAPDARPGFVNKWIRFKTDRGEDAPNLEKALAQGWRPIPKSKIGKQHPLTVNLEGKYGQYVVTRGLILMELPQRLWQQRQDTYRDKQRKMTESIDRNLFRDLDRRTPAWGNERRTSVTRSARRGKLQDSIPSDEG